MQEPEELTLKDLREITDGFSEKAGEGGFGTVYKGVAKTGKHVAVKILRDGIPDLDQDQFRNEFHNLTKVKHDNIVQFLGYCYEREQTLMKYYGRTVLAEKTHRALCFEFMHNGSLQKHLSDESSGLDWNVRYKIIKGTCEGLRYIHDESILHLDLKPDNILLDENMVPKIADFGLSRIFGDQLMKATQSSFGTLGYKPPEYIDNKDVSKKFDIFSLGVIIIKIVSGPESYPKCLRIPSDKFVDQVCKKWRERWQATCSSDFPLEELCHQVETCTQIALDCLEDDSQKRPDIVMIIKKLNKIEPGINKPPRRRSKTVCGMIEWDNRQETSFDIGKELIVGMEEKKKRITSLLEGKSENIIILPIYGIGGIGKTTFARIIYNDTNFKYYSQVWVYVSTRFDLCKIGNSIISQLSGKENQGNELHLIKSSLTELLSRKKQILIVLDDLWENNTFQLVDLKDMLDPGDSIKTIVLVTTRSEDIAKKMCTNIEPYKIEALTDEMCWNIIRQRSCFEARLDKEKLVCIGKYIAKKCGGVALAAQTLGSMLQSVEYDQWVRVRDSAIWSETISKDASLPNHVLASLKLSYVSMDDCLKLCFNSLAIFPKGHKIVKHDIIYQWTSLGLVKPTLLFSTLQLCKKYIDRLLGLTFLQHSVSPMTYRAYNEHETVFTMHDLVHDLASSVLGDEILDQSKEGNARGSNCRYALLTDCSKPLESCTASPARLSALRFLDCQGTELHGSAFEAAESLRVLDLSECSIQKLPDSIGRLKQLRYLNAPRIRDQMVPECITKLSNLRWLSFHGSCAILALPESIGEMEGLVHIDLSGCLGIEKLPESFGSLKSLEHVDFTNCKNVTGVSQCLARLTKLQYLNLSNCGNIGDLPIALGYLTALKYLNLSDSSYLFRNKLPKAEFLGSLTKLKYLNLSSSDNLHIFRLPEALGNLIELKYLNLSRYFTMGKLPASFGNLCNLVHLDLSWCSFLGDVTASLNGLTKLQYLDLYACSGFNSMDGLQEVFGNLRYLRHLNLGCCITTIPSSHTDKVNGLLGQICTLTNLEYLNLSENHNIYSIPETLSGLTKLHTLDLSWCSSLQSLPANISAIESLKYLNTMECRKLDRSTLPQYMSSSTISPDFVATTSDGESSSYHLHVNEGDPAWLKIRLRNVKSAKEAQKIKLVEKIHIARLTLEWTGHVERSVDDAQVLAELEPPYSVSEFCLEGYNSVSFPSWVMRIGSYLPGLTWVEISHLPNCNNLPPLGQLPNLWMLKIRRMDSVRKIGMDLYGGTRAFPQLEQFHIDGMICLEEWNTPYSSEPVFPRLRHLGIKDCPRLAFKPNFLRGRTSLQTLTVSGCESIVSLLECLGDLKSLKELKIANCRGIKTLPDTIHQLTWLRVLTVEDCQSMASLPEWLGDLTSLTKLEICDCRRVKTLPKSMQQLTCLHALTVRGCENMASLPEWLGRDLTSLTKLEISGCKGIKTLPNSMRQLTCLQALTVRDCENITSLPECLADLSSLEILEIANCRGIKTMPIRKVTYLQRLVIIGCPELVRWCNLHKNMTTLLYIKERVLMAESDRMSNFGRRKKIAKNLDLLGT